MMANQQEILSRALKSDVYAKHVQTPTYITSKSNAGGNAQSINYSNLKGSFGGSGGGLRYSGSGNPPSNYYSMSTPITPTTSAAIPDYIQGQRRAYRDIIEQQRAQIDAQGNNGGSDDYTMSDAERFNTQLQNAYLMQQLGYNVNFNDGQMIYSKDQSDSMTPYGAYGYGSDKGPIYETDWIKANQLATQQAQETYKYPPAGQDRYGRPIEYNNQAYGNSYDSYGYYRPYKRTYYRRKYYNRYYSNYNQRYNGSYYNNSQRYNNNNYYRRNSYNSYNRQSYNRNNYNRNRWYG